MKFLGQKSSQTRVPLAVSGEFWANHEDCSGLLDWVVRGPSLTPGKAVEYRLPEQPQPAPLALHASASMWPAYPPPPTNERTILPHGSLKRWSKAKADRAAKPTMRRSAPLGHCCRAFGHCARDVADRQHETRGSHSHDVLVKIWSLVDREQSFALG
jgi:hypothetical protein